MAAEPKLIHLEDADDESDLAELLDDADRRPILIERRGAVYRLSRAVDDDWGDTDPDYVRRVLDETAGSWSDIDADKLIADLYAAREAGTRPLDRPSF